MPSKADQHTIRLDHRFAEWWNVNVSYLRYNSLEPGENWFPGNVASPQQWTLDRKVNATQINNTLTLNPTTVVAIRYGFNRFPNLSSQKSAGYNVGLLGLSPSFVSQIPVTTFPRVTYENFYAGDAMGTNSNGSSVPSSNNFGAQLSKFVGKHSFKFGVDYRKLKVSGVDYGNSAGNFSFTD